MKAVLSGRLPTSAARAAAEDVHAGGPRGAAPAAPESTPEPAPEPAKAGAEELLKDALRLVLAELVPPGAPRCEACTCGEALTHGVCCALSVSCKDSPAALHCARSAGDVSWTGPCVQPAARHHISGIAAALAAPSASC